MAEASDTSNPAATAWNLLVADSALEATIRPQAVFADVQFQGTISNDAPAILPETQTASVAASSTSAAIDPRWIAVLTIAVIAIGVVAILNSKK